MKDEFLQGKTKSIKGVYSGDQGTGMCTTLRSNCKGIDGKKMDKLMKKIMKRISSKCL